MLISVTTSPLTPASVQIGTTRSAGWQAAPPPPMPDMSQLPPEMLEGMARMQANSQFFLTGSVALTDRRA
jgi:hypothetical protein